MWADDGRLGMMRAADYLNAATQVAGRVAHGCGGGMRWGRERELGGAGLLMALLQ